MTTLRTRTTRTTTYCEECRAELGPDELRAIEAGAHAQHADSARGIGAHFIEPVQRTWTTVGAELELELDDERAPVRVSRERYARVFEQLDWEPVAGAKPMLPGLAIKHAIAELRIPKVSRIAISHELAPYGLYGIEGNYKNGRALVYVLDRGSRLVPIASDFYPKEG